MIEGYLTIDEIAEKWNVTPRRVRVLCTSGRIDGAVKFGFVWAIPTDANRPVDNRITTGKYKNWRKKPSDNGRFQVGKIITMISSIFGIAVVSLPAGIVMAGFLEELNRSRNSEEDRDGTSL